MRLMGHKLRQTLGVHALRQLISGRPCQPHTTHQRLQAGSAGH